jgi:hypothetical protein
MHMFNLSMEITNRIILVYQLNIFTYLFTYLLNSGLLTCIAGTLSLESILLCYFGNGVLWTICLGWPQATILLMSVFQVAKLIGVSHQHLTGNFDFNKLIILCLTVSHLFTLRDICNHHNIHMDIVTWNRNTKDTT